MTHTLPVTLEPRAAGRLLSLDVMLGERTPDSLDDDELDAIATYLRGATGLSRASAGTLAAVQGLIGERAAAIPAYYVTTLDGDRRPFYDICRPTCDAALCGWDHCTCRPCTDCA